MRIAVFGLSACIIILLITGFIFKIRRAMFVRHSAPRNSQRRLILIYHRQTDFWSCGVCSLAMCLDVPPDRIREIIGHDGSRVYNPEGKDITFQVEGVGTGELVMAAYKLGYAMLEFLTVPMLADCKTPRPNQPSPQEIVDTFPKGTRFLLLVPSTRFKDSYHYVAYESDQNVYHCPVDGIEPLESLPPTVVISPILRLP